MSADTPEEKPSEGGAPASPPPPPPPAPPAWQPPPKPPRSSAWKWGCGFAGAGCLLLLIVALLIVCGLSAAGGQSTRRGTSSGSGPIALIRINGTIAAGESPASLLSGQTTGSDEVVQQIESAMRDDNIKAILLRVNSPGGSAAGSQEIYDAVNRAKRKGLKVVVSMADVAASGGYYVSANADRIFADPATMTGSIGVIASHQDLSGLYGKLGVKTETIKSGQFKDMLSPTKPIGAGERQLVQTIVMQIYQQFVTAVAKGRRMDEATVRKLADGRIYTGEQAKKLKLVDDLGGFHEALVAAGKMVGYTGRPAYREYGPSGLFRKLFGGGGLGSSRASGVAVSGGLLYDGIAARMVGQMIEGKATADFADFADAAPSAR